MRRPSASRPGRFVPDVNVKARGAPGRAAAARAAAERRHDAIVGEISEATQRLRCVLPVALQFAAVCDDASMEAKLLGLQRLVDRFDAARGRHAPLSDLAALFRRIENGVLEITRRLDVMRGARLDRRRQGGGRAGE